MWDDFPPRMRRAVVSSLELAGRCGREAAGPEHLLAAIASDPQSGGAYVLEQCGVSLDRVIKQFGANGNAVADGDGVPMRAGRLEPEMLQVLEIAAAEAKRHRDDHVGTEHVAVAMAAAENMAAGKFVREMGMTPASAHEALKQWFAEGMPRRRGGLAWRGFRSPTIRRIARPLQKLARAPQLAWKVFAGRSLANPFYTANPYPMYEWLRRNEPVRKDPVAPVWVLTQYEDVNTILREGKFKKDPFASERLPRVAREQLGGFNARVDIETVSMLFLDPPQHTRVRSIFANAFTPRTLTHLRERIEQITTSRLDAAEKSGRMDIIADLAYPLPAIVIADLLGFPPRDYEQIKKWSDDFAAALALNPSAALQAQASVSRAEIRVYYDRIVEELKKKPGDNLISRLLETEEQAGALNREEIFSNGVLLLAAGHETTTNLIGNGMLALMRNRDQWDLLTSDPSLVESAVEEMLRYDAPVQWVSRVAHDQTVLNGVKIPEGEVLLGSVGAANRDPKRFSDPDRFDIRRADNKHLSFGAGVHYCIGAALARMEAQIALDQMVRRFPKMRMESRKVEWIKGLTFRGVKRLAVTLGNQ